MNDVNGRKLSENDQVTLLHVTDEMVAGLPEDEASFLRSMSGQTVTVSEVEETSIEVMMTDRKSGMLHFLRILGSDVRL
ncbi:hypothetical protein [Rhizobium sp. MHM7A]|uniref:hypothetical protein n=1 Tax=Rhizobium sp. MHM7A TaxID=2583233 RepID=UPI001106B974|nr:hypothetical protein [Rhizobium sp. MHM7A]TLX17163.1 hypothetical protein FFR93_07590 [Rhizobium sp. MHM7A]